MSQICENNNNINTLENMQHPLTHLDLFASGFHIPNANNDTANETNVEKLKCSINKHNNNNNNNHNTNNLNEINVKKETKEIKYSHIINDNTQNNTNDITKMEIDDSILNSTTIKTQVNDKSMPNFNFMHQISMHHNLNNNDKNVKIENDNSSNPITCHPTQLILPKMPDFVSLGWCCVV